MAAVTMTPPRQPFATLDAPRLRSLTKSRMNFQNKQSGMSIMVCSIPRITHRSNASYHPGAAITGKRKPLEDIDSENIDPALNASSKRKRASGEDEENMPSKPSRIALKTVESSPVPPRVSSTPLKAPQPSTPKSVPSLKPAGRSPQSKAASCKPFARRSNITKTRPEPAGRKSVHRPFSLATALSNGRSKSPQKTAPAPKPTPASWSFEIHVDSEEEEMTNLMQHSTGVLDISDEETSSAGRGKENVPPSELNLILPTTRQQQESPAAAARKSVMMEESRAPLGELNAADYYGDDCHAFSYAVVHDDDDEEDTEHVPVPEQKKSSASAPVSSRNSTSTQPARSTKLSSVSSISSLLESTAPKAKSKTASEPSESEIDIWESGSAAEEAAQADS